MEKFKDLAKYGFRLTKGRIVRIIKEPDKVELGMKVRYDKDSDVLVLDQGRAGDRIDHAEEMGSVIAHYTKEGRLILLEILDASEFMTAILQAIMRAEAKPPLKSRSN